MTHSRVLLVEFRDQTNRPSIEETAHVLYDSAGFCRDLADEQTTLEMMITAGQKYKQLEIILAKLSTSYSA